MKVKHFVILAASVMICAILIMTSLILVDRNYTNQIETTQANIKEVVTKNVETYIKEYVVATAAAGDESSDSGSGLTELSNTQSNFEDNDSQVITKDVTQGIIDEVTQIVTVNVLKEMASSFTAMKEETIVTMDNKIQEAVTNVLSNTNNYSSTVITPEEMSYIANDIQLIVEASIMQELTTNYKTLESNMRALQVAVDSKIARMELTMSGYDQRIQDVETRLNSTTTKTGEIGALSIELQQLTEAYTNFLKCAISTTNIVNTYTAEQLADQSVNGVMSASAGAAMYEELLQKLNNTSVSFSAVLTQQVDTLERLSSVNTEDINALQNDLANNTKALQDVLNTKMAISDANNAITTAMFSAGQARNDAIKDTQDKLSKAISDAQQSAINAASMDARQKAEAVAENLQSAKDELERALSAAGDDTSAVNTALLDTKSFLEQQDSELQADIDALKNTTTKLALNISVLENDLAVNTKALQNTLDTKIAITDATAAIDAAVIAEGDERKAAIEKTLTDLQKAISDAEDAVTNAASEDAKKKAEAVAENLRQTKEALEKSLAEAGEDTASVNSALNKTKEDLLNADAGLQSSIDTLSNTATKLGSDIVDLQNKKTAELDESGDLLIYVY